VYIAIPEKQKVRLKSLIDTIGVRGAEGIGAVLLILLFSLLHLPLHTLIVITLIAVAAWFTASILLGREYPELLRNRLQRKDLDFATVKEQLFSTDFYRLLPQLLREGEPQNIYDLLEILEKSDKRWLGRYVQIPLRHEDPKIRLKALQLLFRQDGNLSSTVKNLLDDTDRRIRAEAAHYLCIHSELKTGQTEKFLEENDLVLQAAVCACALKTRPDEKIVYEKLEQLIKESLASSDPEPRVEIAHVLEFAPSSEHVERICAILLKDPEEKVRKAALAMIERTHPARMFPLLIRLTRDTSLLKEVRSALAAYGEALLPQLQKIMEDGEASLEQKKLALKVAGDIGGAPAAGFLLETAKHKNVSARFAALKALNRLRKKQPCEPDVKILSSLLEEEVVGIEKQLEWEAAFSANKEHLLWKLLRQRRQWGIERIFRMLGLLFDSEAIYSTYLAWMSGNFRKTDTALEFLDTLITPDLRTRILPLLEFEGPVSLTEIGTENVKNQDADSKMAIAPMNKKRPEMTRKDAFFSLLREREPVLSSLAITDLTGQELRDWQDKIRKELKDFPSDKMVEETLTWRLNMNTETDAKENTPTTIQKMEFLNKFDIFARLGAQELLLLAEVSEIKTFEANEQIYKEGESAQEIYGVIDGAVKLSRSKGHVRTIKPGGTFGTHEVLANKPHIFSATAKMNTRCLRIDRESFGEILEEYPSIARGIFAVLVDQIEQLTDKVLDASQNGTP
jgi:HEAT repeat protein